MYNVTEFCVKYGDDEVTDFVEQKRRVRKGCSLSLYLFNTVIDDIDYTRSDQNHQEQFFLKRNYY
jgi:hypothetical protein